MPAVQAVGSATSGKDTGDTTCAEHRSKLHPRPNGQLSRRAFARRPPRAPSVWSCPPCARLLRPVQLVGLVGGGFAFCLCSRFGLPRHVLLAAGDRLTERTGGLGNLLVLGAQIIAARDCVRVARHRECGDLGQLGFERAQLSFQAGEFGGPFSNLPLVDQVLGVGRGVSPGCCELGVGCLAVIRKPAADVSSGARGFH